MFKLKNGHASAACLLLGCLGIALLAHAQTTGVITGTVTDPSGAVVSGVKIVVRNVGTREERSLVTNSSGVYTAYSLPVGQYEIEATLAGFKKTTQTGIQLNVTDQLAINFVLQVGSSAETVEVSAENAAQVDTEKADVNYVVQTRQMTDLAVNGRTFTLLQQLLPGASRDPGTGDEGGTGFNSSKGFAINGQRQEATGFQVDGVENTDVGNSIGLLTSPGMETIAEFKMVTSNYSAEYGTAGGANILVVTRTGTKQFHGAAYEFFRNDALDARYYFADSKPFLRYNNFGYRIGGPVTIPGLYNHNRDKTFFFFAEEWRRKNTQQIFRTATPTAAMRSGDFSAEAARIGKPILDPQTGQPFPNNQIPAGRIDNNALLLLKQNFPLPNFSGDPFNNYLANGFNDDNWRQETLNVTHQLTKGTQISVRYIQDTEVEPQQGVLWSGQAFPDIGSVVNLPGHSFLAKATTVISPEMLNEVSYNYASNYGSQSQKAVTLSGDYLAPSGLTIQHLFPLGPGRPNTVPDLTFAGGWGGINTGFYPWYTHHNIESVNDNFSWSRGTHSFKFGGVFQYSATPSETAVPDQGSFTFTGAFTHDPIADFLLGQASSYSQVNARIIPYYDYHQLELFAQDTWKVTQRLTLNLGVRYFYIPHLYEADNLLLNFVPGRYDPAQAVTVLPNGTVQSNAGNLTNGLIGTKNGLPTDLVNNQPWKFGPRIGFAYDPTGSGKWAIRGGYGAGYYRPAESDSYYLPAISPTTGAIVSNVTVFNPSLDNPATGTAGALEPLSIPSLARTYAIPTVQTYSLDVEHEIVPGSLVTLGYVGSRGTHLHAILNIDQPQPEGGFDFDPRLNANAVSAAFLAPYKGYASITQGTNYAASTYHSLQAAFKRRMSRGLLLEASYTFSKAMTDASTSSNPGYTPQNSYNPSVDRSLAAFDRTNILALNYIYELPFFHSQNGFLGQALGGWQISGITQFDSGTPLTVGLTGSNLGLATRPNLVSGQSVAGPKSRTEWFNTAAFLQPAAGFFGDARPDIVRGPGFQTWDLALFKTFKLTEHTKFDFRGDAFNAFNHTNWSGVSTNLGAGDFGQVNAAHEARVMEVSGKIEF